MPPFRQAPLGRRSGSPEHEAMREEVHYFDALKIPETAPIASVQIAMQPCACCNAMKTFCSFLVHYL